MKHGMAWAAGFAVAGWTGAAVAADGHGPHWGYDGDAGPGQWGALSPEFAACGVGRSQSPIDLRVTDQAQMEPLTLKYRVSPLDVVYNGHTVQVNVAQGSTLQIGDKRFRLLQYHFHTPSEHQVDGHVHPMEIHFVHRDEAGHLAVVGVMVEPGESHLAAQEVWDNLADKATPSRKAERVLVNARDLMPDSLGYYRYMGSLTTPPCSEGVNWYVLKMPVQFSTEQIGRVEAIMGRNARPVQVRHDRMVLGAKEGK